MQELLSASNDVFAVGARLSGLPFGSSIFGSSVEGADHTAFATTIVEADSPSRALADVLLELKQVEAELMIAESQVSQCEISHAMAESNATGFYSEQSIFTSDTEAAEIAQTELSLKKAREESQILHERLQGLQAEVAVLEERLREKQERVDAYGEIIPTAEGLDTERNIEYLEEFGLSEEEVYSPSVPTLDPDEQMKSVLNDGWNKSGEDPNGVDYENCCIYVLHTLEEAGYDLDAQVEVDGTMVTARRLVLIHAESLLSERKDALSDIAQDPEHRYYDVLKGVVTALTATNQGREIEDVHAIRPGDLLQWWTANNMGHTVIVHQVRTSAGVLSGSSDASDPALQAGLEVDAVSVLGSHTSHRSFNQGQTNRGEEANTSEEGQDIYGREDHVYATDFIELREDHTGKIPYFSGKSGELVSWWVVRPAGSDWDRPATPAPL